MNYENRWPIITNEGKKKWEKRIVAKEITYTIKYQAGDILGYYDIVYPNDKNLRTETVDA